MQQGPADPARFCKPQEVLGGWPAFAMMHLKFFPQYVFALAGFGATDREQLHRRDLAYSAPFYPSPWMNPNANGWEDAYAKAKAFVSQLTLMEKVNLTTGVG